MRQFRNIADSSGIETSRRGSSAAFTLTAIGIATFAGILTTVWALATGAPVENELSQRASESKSSGRNRFPVTIRKPDGPPRVLTGAIDPHGQPVTASCSTCHATRPPKIATRNSADLTEFHKGLPMSHGSLSCLACHNPKDYDSLKLADGTRVEFSNVMTLCAQCHGPQMKDYEHGAHGGLNGYWDRSRGPQTKLNCVDCHHPHTPQFPKMKPTFKPKDRFLGEGSRK